MQKAHFADVEITDLTSEFLNTARSWHAEFARNETAVKKVIGEARWEDRQTSRSELIAGIQEGLLRRILVSGRAE